MKKYYTHNGVSQEGPFTIDEIKAKQISRDAMIWYEGMETWTKAGDIEELKSVFPAIPPPFIKQQNPAPPLPKPIQSIPPQKKKSKLGIIGWILLVVIGGAIILMFNNNPKSFPGMKVQINIPKPTVVTKRIEDASTLLKLKETIYATIMNQGGDGNVLVTFHLLQDGNDFTRTESIYLSSNQSADLNQTFDEVTRLGGDMKYYVEAKAQ